MTLPHPQKYILTRPLDVKDVEKLYPGLIDATRNWFKIYKIPDGKPENSFAFNGDCKDQSYANSIVAETHDAWKKLIKGHVEKHNIDLYVLSSIQWSQKLIFQNRNNTTISNHRVESEKIDANKETFDTKEESAKGYDPKWYFV